MSEWGAASLGQLIELAYGTALADEDRSGSGYPVYGSNGIVGYHDQPLVAGPGIVVGRKGSVGALAWSDRDFWPIDTKYWVNAGQGIDLRWAYEAMKLCGLQHLSSSTGVPGLNREDAYERSVQVPPVGEQQRITEILDAVDETIRATESTIVKYKGVRSGLLSDSLGGQFHELFAGQWKSNEAPRNQATTNTPETLGADEWNCDPLSNLICHIASGPSPTCEERTAVGLEWGLLKTTAVTWSGWDETEHKVPPTEYWGQEALEVQPDDIIITKAGPRNRVGVVVHVPSTRPRLMVSGKMILVRPNTSRLIPGLLADLLATRRAQKYLDDRTSGMAEAQTNFTNASLLGIPLRIPPLDEQRWIAGILETIARAITTNESQLSKLHQLRSGLAADLLSGRVRTVTT